MNFKKCPSKHVLKHLSLIWNSGPNEGGWDSSVGVATCCRVDGSRLTLGRARRFLFSNTSHNISRDHPVSCTYSRYRGWSSRDLCRPATPIWRRGLHWVHLCAFMACAVISLPLDVDIFGSLKKIQIMDWEFQSPFPMLFNIHSEK
jgi:hypothetical protein